LIKFLLLAAVVASLRLWCCCTIKAPTAIVRVKIQCMLGSTAVAATINSRRQGIGAFKGWPALRPLNGVRSTSDVFNVGFHHRV
jgi:hypothetical protein